MSKAYVVAFEGRRVGRHHGVDALWIADTGQGAQELAEQIHREVRRFLVSADYDVIVDLDRDGTGKGTIGLGRYGTFSIAYVVGPFWTGVTRRSDLGLCA